jgi:Domain of unknown function (DUF4351)
MRNMSYMTSVERIGYERGRYEERRSTVSRQLERKLDQIPATLSNRISTLSFDQLGALAIALLKFNSIEGLSHWLESNR